MPISAKYYLILDIGTTTVKAFAYSEDGKILKKVLKTTNVLFPEPGYVEQDPEKLWQITYDAATEIINEYGKPNAMGITNQRASTIVWDKETGEPLYNMITWQDTRASDIAKKYTKVFLLKVGRAFGKIANGLSKIIPGSRKSKRLNYLVTMAFFKFGPNQPIMHLRWLLDNVDEVSKAAKDGKLAFGTIDSWIIWKMLSIHVTDYTNASATGLFDPFFLKWSDRLTKIVCIPKRILPKLIDNMGELGKVKIFENAPLTAVIADQQSSLYSAGGFNSGTIKITNGTGTFIDINVGKIPMPGRYGTYPMVAIKWRNKVNYLLEGIVQTTGSAVDWLVSIGILSDPSEASKLAESVKDSDDVIFIPALAGVGTPYWNPKVKGLILGLTRGTRREHIVKALLDGIAIRCAEVLSIIEKASGIKISHVIADGNASRNDYLLQAIADFSNKQIRRVENLEGTSRGAFLLAKGALNQLDIEKAWSEPTYDKIIDPGKREPKEWQYVFNLMLRYHQ